MKAKCIIIYWKSKKKIQMKCPICRRFVMNLKMKNIKDLVNQKDNEDIKFYNFIYSSTNKNVIIF